MTIKQNKKKLKINNSNKSKIKNKQKNKFVRDLTNNFQFKRFANLKALHMYRIIFLKMQQELLNK